MENAATTIKRSRDDGDSPEAPESKRTRADLLLSILDDESEPDNTDIDSVIRSLEEEIALPRTVSHSGAGEISDPNPKQPDLGFLFEASDDELGLPPPGTAVGDVTSGETACSADVVAGGFGKIWGIDDDFHLDFAFGSDDGKDDNGEGDGDGDGAVIFDGGLFESELTWRTEYLPAV